MKTNEHLFHFLPFLRNEYRLLKKEELNSEETFKELFPGEEINLTKLEQIYNFQNIVTVTENPSEIVVDYSALKNNGSKETFDLYYPENEVDELISETFDIIGIKTKKNGKVQ